MFESIEREEYEAIQDPMNSVFPTANVFTGAAGGYCLEKDQRPPAPGEFYALGGVEAQQRFEPQRRILAAARTLYQTSALHPDCDDEAYFHSIRQWAIWAKEKGFDRDSFTESFIAHTKSNLEANGQSWSRQIEDNVAALAPNRWSDIQAVLELADTV